MSAPDGMRRRTSDPPPTAVAYLPSHRWEPWDCHLHGWHSDSYEMCPGCEEDFIQMGDEIGNQWAEEEAAEQRKLIRPIAGTTINPPEPKEPE